MVAGCFRKKISPEGGTGNPFNFSNAAGCALANRCKEKCMWWRVIVVYTTKELFQPHLRPVASPGTPLSAFLPLIDGSITNFNAWQLQEMGTGVLVQQHLCECTHAYMAPSFVPRHLCHWNKPDKLTRHIHQYTTLGKTRVVDGLKTSWWPWL